MSIRRQLVFSLLIGLTLLFAAASTALYLYARGAFIGQFEEALEARTRSFAGMSELENRSGLYVIELEFVDFPLPEFQPGPDAEYYQVWKSDGSTLARSPSLNGKDLPAPEISGDSSYFNDLVLHDGRSGRAVSFRFIPKPETEMETAETAQETKADGTALWESSETLVITLARSREKLDHTLEMLLSAILANLFSNAVIHTPNGGSVKCRIMERDGGFAFCLENTNDQLNPDDLRHLFEPLWKKDPSRTDAGCNGLGLSLVAAYAGLLELELSAALPEPDRFEISFTIPAA